MRKIILGSLFLIMTLLCTACGGNSISSDSTGKIDVMVNWKELTDPRGLYPEESTATGMAAPQIVETSYETNDVVIADIVPTEMGYAVDPTGATDSTDGIQQALYDCYNSGGGTVYLPAGNYAITDTIYIPNYVTLRGDWQDPDEGTEYGTIFSVWMSPSDGKEGGAFMVSSCSGVVGMTVYYPFQTLYEVLPYPCTFYVEDGSTIVTLKNITVINGYRGVGTSFEIPHECLLIDNFKGTFLDYGVNLNNSADVGTIDNVVFSTKYWKEAAADCMNAPVSEVVDEYVKTNAIGMVMSDLEWTDFGNVTIDGYSVGMKFVEGFRYKFAGSMIDVNVTNCSRGLLIEKADERWGMVVARSNIDSGVINAWTAKVRLTDTTVNGDIKELVSGTVEQNDVDLSSYEINYDATYVKPKENLIVANITQGLATDVSSELQAVLNEMKAEGGGVVYVPGGIYRLDNPITVPAGVELRGASSVASREILSETQGTLFMSYYGDEASYNAETDKALITLAGEYAGLSGVRILYPENGPRDNNLNTTYTVRGTAKGVYVVNCYIAATGYGIDFRNCDEHYIKSVYSCCYYNAYRLGGENGMIRGCLNNPNMIERTMALGRLDWMEVGKLADEVTNPITRVNTQAIILDGAKNQFVYDVFSYGSKNHIVNRNSEATLAVNIGSDNLNAEQAQIVNENASMVVINSLRYNGHSYDNTNGSLKLYNRITMDEPDEKLEVIGEGE